MKIRDMRNEDSKLVVMIKESNGYVLKTHFIYRLVSNIDLPAVIDMSSVSRN